MGGNPPVLELRLRVELDLLSPGPASDLLSPGPASELVEGNLLLPSKGVVVGVIPSTELTLRSLVEPDFDFEQKSDPGGLLYKEDMWSEAETKEKPEEGPTALDPNLLDLIEWGEVGGNMVLGGTLLLVLGDKGEVFLSSGDSLGRLEDIFSIRKSRSSVLDILQSQSTTSLVEVN